MLQTGSLNIVQANLLYLGLDGRNVLSADLNFYGHAAKNLGLEVVGSLPGAPFGKGHILQNDGDGLVYYSANGTTWAALNFTEPLTLSQVLTVNGGVQNTDNETLSFVSSQSGSSTALAYSFDTAEEYVTAGGNLLTWKTGGVSRLTLDYSGNLTVTGALCVSQTAGEVLTSGQVIYSSGNDTVKLAIADASAVDLEKAWGVSVAGCASGVSGSVAYAGPVMVDMDTGLSPAVGKLAYLSNVTAGSSMDNPPATPTHYIVELGRIISMAGYPGTGKVKVIWQPKEPILIP